MNQSLPSCSLTVARVFVVPLCLVCLGSFAQEKADAAKGAPTKLSRTLELATMRDLMAPIEPWPEGSTAYAREGWRNLVKAARVLQQTEPSVVEKALRRYQQSVRTFANFNVTDSHGTDEDGKLLIVMRLVFDLPEKYDGEAKVFDNFKRPSEFSRKGQPINLAWPLSWNSGGPKLVAEYPGLTDKTARYAAADEFAFFHKKFPYRDLAEFKW